MAHSLAISIVTSGETKHARWRNQLMMEKEICSVDELLHHNSYFFLPVLCCSVQLGVDSVKDRLAALSERRTAHSYFLYTSEAGHRRPDEIMSIISA